MEYLIWWVHPTLLHRMNVQWLASTAADDAAASLLGRPNEALAGAISPEPAACHRAERVFCTRGNIPGVPLAMGVCIRCERLNGCGGDYKCEKIRGGRKLNEAKGEVVHSP
jgi:hypothetical protein